jgi:hypothetical protein
MRSAAALQMAQVRYKGHSKWQNIRHIKAANDLRIGRLCNKYAHLIGIAIRENGMEKNPEYNCKSGLNDGATTLSLMPLRIIAKLRHSAHLFYASCHHCCGYSKCH